MAKTTIRGSVTLSSKKCTVTVSSTAPLNPSEYTLWIDTSDNNVLKRWENGKWVNINDNKVVIQYFNEELKNNYYKKTETNSLLEQIVGDVHIKTDGSIGDGYKNLSTRIEESNSSFKQTSDEIVASVKSLRSTVGGEVYNSTPTVPYSEKDLWVQTNSDNDITIKICANARTKDEVFHEEDWKVVEDEKLDNYGLISTVSYSKIRQLSDKFEWIVSDGTSSSNMTLTEDMLKIVAENIDLQGNAVFKSLTDVSNGVTTIDGGKIKTGSISADKINVTQLFSKDIVMTGTLTSYYSDNTSQLTIGDGKLQLYSKSSGFSGIEIKRDILEFENDYATAINIRSDFIDIVRQGNANRIAIGRVIYKQDIEKGFGMYYTTDNATGFEFWDTQQDGKCNMYLSGDSQVGGMLAVGGMLTVYDILTVSNIVPLTNTLVVDGYTKFKKSMLLQSNDSVLENQISNDGMYFSSTGNNEIPSSYEMRYTADGMYIYNRMGDCVGGFCVYEDYWSSKLEAEYIESKYDILCKRDLTVSGATTLSSTLTVNGDTTHKGNISFSYDIYTNRITYYGITFTNSNYSGNIQYTADGVKVVNRTGEVVGSFGFYNDHWDANLQSGYINAKYENGCGNFKLKADISDGYNVDFLVNTSYPYLRFKQYANWFVVNPSTSYGVGLGTESLPFGDVRANNVYNSSGIITSSDRRVKEDVKDIDDNFVNTLIDSLSAKTYKYIDNTSNRTHCGAIAQDVEEIIINMGLTTQDFGGVVKSYKTKEVENEDKISSCEIDYETEPNYYLRYEEFIMPLVRYCQLLKQRIEALEKDTASKNETSE